MNDPINILIVDDEALARQKIERMLRAHGGNFKIRESRNGIEALAAIKDSSPDILFLDVQMPGLSGFQVLQQVVARPFAIIFQTAFDEFAVRAFDEAACDYLLKPFSQERFDRALQRALAGLSSQQEANRLEENLIAQREYLQRLVIRRGEERLILNVNEVECFLSQNHYTCVYVGNTENLSDLSLNHLSERLDPEKFVRIHRNCIINVSHLKAATANMVSLESGRQLPISRRLKANMRNRLKNLWYEGAKSTPKSERATSSQS